MPSVHSSAVVLLPTYNERDNIGRLLAAILSRTSADVLVIDDRSPDQTAEIVRQLAANEPRIGLLVRDGPRGLGRAYLDGMRLALARGYDFIVQMDADFSHPPDLIPTLLEAAARADLVIASRYVKGGGVRHWPLRRKILSRGGSLYARLWLNLPFKDLTSGFKCFRRRTLEAIDLSAVRSNGYAFQIEMTWLAYQRRLRIVEVPFVFVDRERGQSKMSKKIFLEAMRICAQLRFKSLGEKFGLY